MNPIPPDKAKLEEIEREACAWVLKLDRGLSPKEQDELTDWLGADVLHRNAMTKHSWAWEELDRLAGLQTTPGLPINPNLLDEDLPSSFWFHRLLKKRKVFLSLAASTVLVLLAFWVQIGVNQPEQPTPPAMELVPFERIQTMRLSDGSRIELNHGAIVEEHYSASERSITLVQGEASFEVAKNPDRPFVVHVSSVRLVALGTVFNVRENEDFIDLIVSEGRVQVLGESALRSFAPESMRSPVIGQAERAIVTLGVENQTIEVISLEQSQIEEELIWQPELIEFIDTPLIAVVSEFNRRNRIQIQLLNPSLQSMPLSGVFWSDNVEGFVRLLETNFNANIEWSRDEGVILGPVN